MTRGKIILIAAAVVALAAGWYFGSPGWTLWQMSKAAEARDSEKLAAYIDFPTLRETTKAQMKAQMMASAQQQGGQSGFGALGAMIGMAMIDPIIDGLLTPETMRVAFERAPKTERGARGGAEGAEKGAGQAGGAAAGESASAPAADGANDGPLGIDPEEMKLVHKGLNEFRLRKKNSKGEAGDLIFRRHGLGWKLEEVRIPAGSLAPPGQP